MTTRISAEALLPARAMNAPVGEASENAPSKEWMTVQGALKKAADHFAAGRLAEAGMIALEVRDARPNVADAWNILGVVAHRQGRTDEAIQSVKQAIKLNPRNAGYFANLGEMQRRLGKLDAAMIALKKAIRLNARAHHAWNNLGIVHYDKKQFGKAAECYRQAVILEPTYAEACNNLGNALRNLGQLDEAIVEYETAIRLRPDYPEAYNNMATVLRDQNRLNAAEQAYRQAMALRPRYFDACNNLANVLVLRKRPDDALKLLSKLLAERPGNPAVLVNVARAHVARRDYGSAEKILRQVLGADPDNVAALTVYGELCHDTDRFSEAVRMLRKAVARDPDNVEAWNLLGVAQKSMGAMDEAREAFARAIKLQPGAVDSYANMVDIETFTPGHPMLATMEAQLASLKDDGDDERFQVLNFALGKAFDDIGDYPRAMQHFQQATARRRSQLVYREAEVLGYFDEIRAAFTSEFLAHPPYEGNSSDRPIFIIGFPRSGSTLTEQIIASHPQAHGAGEVKHLFNVMSSLRRAVPNLQRYPAIVHEMTAPQFARVAKLYLDRLGAGAGNAQRVTDKMLTNFYLVGLIHILFPQARIIHTMRNPMDTCLSAWTKLFKDDMPHTYDLAELGRYYAKYSELMDHWRSVLPAGVMLDIHYEEIVGDLEGSARRIIDFAGLPWNDACLAFHASKRPVKTASLASVRKPIYDTAVGRWRHYGDFLQPLAVALGPVAGK